MLVDPETKPRTNNCGGVLSCPVRSFLDVCDCGSTIISVPLANKGLEFVGHFGHINIKVLLQLQPMTFLAQKKKKKTPTNDLFNNKFHFFK